MVWFQCEDCGENLKKPKLANHFRICSAFKLSCIDCGEIFGQDSVQGHTQCITEAEKYGPKGLGKAPNAATPKSNKDSKQPPDFDINVGLSDRPPWFCSICNTKATSRQTLLLHADGKKHKAKARAIHFAKQQTKQKEEPIFESKVSTENTTQSESLEIRNVEEQKLQGAPKGNDGLTKSVTENGKVPSKKKRKLDASEHDGIETENGGDATDGAVNGVNQVESSKGEAKGSKLKKTKHNLLTDDKVMESGDAKEDTKKKIKWKKLIKSALRSNPDGVLKMRNLKKFVLKSIQESGIMEDENQLTEMLEQKITSSSRFKIDGKFVLLAAKD